MKIDDALLYEFESGLNPQFVEQSAIPAKIVGYGEISAIFQIHGDDARVYKRLPLFADPLQARAYERMYYEYSDLLVKAGLNLPKHQTRIIQAANRPASLYIIQEKLEADQLCHLRIQQMTKAEALLLIRQVLEQIRKVWAFNRNAPGGIQLAIDGQLSNWVGDPTDPDRLLYIDTSTPLYTKNGVEQQNPELMLQSAPGFLRWIIRLFFLQDVMTRYYNPRLVYTDLAGNLYKEQRPDLVEPVVGLINEVLPPETAPLTGKEVDGYYREDKIIWSLFLAFRKIDRFLLTKLLRKRYEFILPGNIKR